MAEAPDALDPISALREHHRTAQRAQAVNHAKAPERGANGWVFVGKCSGNQGKSQGKTFFFCMFHGNIRGFRFRICLSISKSIDNMKQRYKTPISPVRTLEGEKDSYWMLGVRVKKGAYTSARNWINSKRTPNFFYVFSQSIEGVYSSYMSANPFTFFIFQYIGNNSPNWLIFFRGVQTTNQIHLNMQFFTILLNCH